MKYGLVRTLVLVWLAVLLCIGARLLCACEGPAFTTDGGPVAQDGPTVGARVAPEEAGEDAADDEDAAPTMDRIDGSDIKGRRDGGALERLDAGEDADAGRLEQDAQEESPAPACVADNCPKCAALLSPCCTYRQVCGCSAVAGGCN